MDFLSENFVNRFHGSVIYFLSLSVMALQQTKEQFHLCAHAIFSSGGFGWSFKPDECDGCRQHMAVTPEAAVIMGTSADKWKNTLSSHPELPISCLPSPA